jgi:hypothetical protein
MILAFLASLNLILVSGVWVLSLLVSLILIRVSGVWDFPKNLLDNLIFL